MHSVQCPDWGIGKDMVKLMQQAFVLLNLAERTGIKFII